MVVKHKQRKKKKFKSCGKSNSFQKFVQNKKKRKTEKELQHFQEMQISGNESKKGVSSFVESVERGEISASSSKWKRGSDELFITCLNDCDKMAKKIKNYSDLFIKTSLNHMSIRSRLVSQPNKKLKLNSEQLLINPQKFTWNAIWQTNY